MKYELFDQRRSDAEDAGIITTDRMNDQDKLELERIEEQRQKLVSEGNDLKSEHTKALDDLRAVEGKIADHARRTREFYTNTHPEMFGGEKF